MERALTSRHLGVPRNYRAIHIFQAGRYCRAAASRDDAEGTLSPSWAAHCSGRRSFNVAAADLQAKGAYTKAGTWAPNQEEADMIEAIVDRDERWEQSLIGKEHFLDRPFQPPGLLRSGDPKPPPSLSTPPSSPVGPILPISLLFSGTSPPPFSTEHTCVWAPAFGLLQFDECNNYRVAGWFRSRSCHLLVAGSIPAAGFSSSLMSFYRIILGI
jgi:hypothetical protein